MRLRLVQLLLLGSLLAAQSWAAADPFIGKWKLDPHKSKLPDEMTVEAAGGNKYTFKFIPGAAETIVTDGTDQPGIPGTTLAVSVEDPHTWKVVRKKDGQTIVNATWKLSDDANTLTDHVSAAQPDGKTVAIAYTYKRTAGTGGFAGTWESTDEQIDASFELHIETFEDSGLSMIFPSQGTTTRFKFDGKDYPASGNVPPGYAASARRVDARTIAVTSKLNGKVANTRQLEMSPDSKVLTMTINYPDQSKPKIFVFNRE